MPGPVSDMYEGPRDLQESPGFSEIDFLRDNIDDIIGSLIRLRVMQEFLSFETEEEGIEALGEELWNKVIVLDSLMNEILDV